MTQMPQHPSQPEFTTPWSPPPPYLGQPVRKSKTETALKVILGSLVALAVAIVGVIALRAGDGTVEDSASAADGAAAPATSTYVPHYTAPRRSAADVYLDAVRDQESSFASVPDSMLLQVGHATCDFLESGEGDVYDAGLMGIDSGLTTDQAGTVVAGAVLNFCPEYGSQY